MPSLLLQLDEKMLLCWMYLYSEYDGQVKEEEVEETGDDVSDGVVAVVDRSADSVNERAIAIHRELLNVDLDIDVLFERFTVWRIMLCSDCYARIATGTT